MTVEPAGIVMDVNCHWVISVLSLQTYRMIYFISLAEPITIHLLTSAVGIVPAESILSGLAPTNANNEAAGRIVLVAGSLPTDSTPGKAEDVL